MTGRLKYETLHSLLAIIKVVRGIWNQASTENISMFPAVQSPVVAPSPLSEEDEACLRAMLFSSAHVFPMILNAATQLGLFDIIARAGPGAQLSPSEMASELGAMNQQEVPPKLDRMLRLLASHSLLTCSMKTPEGGKVERLYGLTPASQFFVKNDGEESLASLLALSLHPAPQQVW